MTYYPDLNYVGPDSITFSATDSHYTSTMTDDVKPMTASISMTVLMVDTPPELYFAETSLHTYEDEVLNITGITLVDGYVI